ncbi:MAG: hypothetical protein IJT18_08025 [Oscillospiraceae bacterium]|nr:hypothetical protein [Oscillospiraceae bacterium]
MNCPKCKTGTMAIIDTDDFGTKVVRKRRCRACGETAFSVEIYRSVWERVRKNELGDTVPVTADEAGDFTIAPTGGTEDAVPLPKLPNGTPAPETCLLGRHPKDGRGGGAGCAGTLCCTCGWHPELAALRAKAIRQHGPRALMRKKVTE